MRAREISLDVDVMCEGCASAVRRICARIDGVTRVDVDVDSKTVVIVGDGLDPDDVRARVAKLSLIHISSPRDKRQSRMPSSA